MQQAAGNVRFCHKKTASIHLKRFFLFMLTISLQYCVTCIHQFLDIGI